MDDIIRFKVCLRCNTCLPIISEGNFYEIEKFFDTQHKNHLTTIMIEQEMFTCAEKKEIMKKVHENDILFRNLKYSIDNPNSAEKLIFNTIRDENIQLLKMWSSLGEQYK